MSVTEWSWDESLYAGAAVHYVAGRAPYSPALGPAVAERLRLCGEETLLDVGCGPGPLVLALGPFFGQVEAVEPDRGMLDLARERAQAAGMSNVTWYKCRAEELPERITGITAATFGQSFHWMDRPKVARSIHERLRSGGAFIKVGLGRAEPGDLHDCGPAIPREDIHELVVQHLGPGRRAGRGTLSNPPPPGFGVSDDRSHAEILEASGFERSEAISLPGEGALTRSIDQVVSLVLSNSASTPHLLGRQLGSFVADLRDLLAEASPRGTFTEPRPSTEVIIWWKS
jgi:SAM-dependent methyltransferase